MVRVIDDMAEVHRLQKDGHGWHDDMALVSMGIANCCAACVIVEIAEKERGLAQLDLDIRFHMQLWKQSLEENNDVMACCYYYIALLHTGLQSLGQLGRVKRVTADGAALVYVNGRRWLYHPLCLTSAPGEQPEDEGSKSI